MTISERQHRANAIRVLSADAVQKANSGHPGAPMGMADMAEVLWNDFLQHNPNNPHWVNRDRFVLSNGHASMLLYSLLHLTGYDVSMEDLQDFRQMDSKTPGHPEYADTPGVETTTGPLGQGIANAVGMAIAQKNLASEFNTAAHQIIDHFTYAFVGDGCLMEGVSHEVCSLAGTLGLGKLIVLWDDNGISIDGKVQGWFTDDTAKRFSAYGWQVIADVDGHDANAIAQAIKAGKSQATQPTLICCRTIIGKGAPNKQDSAGCHGAPLGEQEITTVRETLLWDSPAFVLPKDIAQQWNQQQKGKVLEAKWDEKFAAYQQQLPEKAEQLLRRLHAKPPENWQQKTQSIIHRVQQEQANLATRKASLHALNDFIPLLPEMMGGSADLAGSNYTISEYSKAITPACAKGNYIYFGVREFAMSAIANGMALYGGFKPYVGTFLVFSDYMRNGMRMSALMKQPVTYVLTHDSIGLGEDGPTHQPVEHTASLRLIPNMSVWRPADAVETYVAWQQALSTQDHPTSLILSRQACAHQARNAEQLANIEKGAYVLHDCAGEPEIIILATGSEVGIATQATQELQAQGVAARLVSMPSCDYFDKQSEAYRESVLPSNVTRRLAIEAGSKEYWYKYVGLQGDIIGMSGFGKSAPADELMAYYGFSVENVIEKAQQLLR